MLARCMIIVTLPLSMAFTGSPRRWSTCQLRESSVALPAKNDGIAEEIGRSAGAVLLGLTLVASPTMSSAVPMTDSITPSLHSSLVISKGAYTSEEGYDDFSGGLTMPKYTVNNAEQLGLGGAGNKIVDPTGEQANKLEKASARAAAAKLAKKQEAEKKAEAQAKKKADAIEKAKAKEEAIAAKRAKQLESMNEEQRAKYEASEAKKKANGGEQPNAIDNMKRMYSIKKL